MSTTLYAAGSEFTLRNLLAAYQGELNAQARYKAFAAKADADGLHGIASLFRAAARAEQIHASNQARALRQMGGEPATEIYACQVRSTLENLQAALAGETYEIETLYPAFIEEAHTHINATAARSFALALEAEKGHARLYSEAIALVKTDRDGSWINARRAFYVCPVCARTSTRREPENCGICHYPADRAEEIC